MISHFHCCKVCKLTTPDEDSRKSSFNVNLFFMQFFLIISSRDFPNVSDSDKFTMKIMLLPTPPTTGISHRIDYFFSLRINFLSCTTFRLFFCMFSISSEDFAASSHYGNARQEWHSIVKLSSASVPAN